MQDPLREAMIRRQSRIDAMMSQMRSPTDVGLEVEGYSAPSHEASSWGDVGWGTLGLIEEGFTKAIGNVFSDDPKYDWIGGQWNKQVSFTDLAGDAIEGVTGSRSPIAAMIIGLAAGLANPLDPLNKIKILSMTKKGILASQAGKMAKVGGTIETLEAGITGTRKIKTLDPARLDGLLHEARRGHRTAQVAARGARGLSEEVGNVARSKRALRHAERSRANLDMMNESLVEAQRKGVSYEELMNMGSFRDQIRKGQRRVLGFSSPLKFNHIPFVQGDVFSDASRSLAGGFKDDRVRLFGRQIGKPIDDMTLFLGHGAKEMGVPLLKWGRALVDKVFNTKILSPHQKELTRRVFDKVHSASDLTEKELMVMHEAVADAVKESGGSYRDMETALRNAFEEITGQPVQGTAFDSKLRALREVQGEDVIEGAAKVSPRGRVAGHVTRRLFSADPIQPNEAKNVIDDWNGAPVKSTIGNRPAVVTGRYAIIDGTEEVDPHILREIQELVGVARFVPVELGDRRVYAARKVPYHTRLLGPLQPGKVDGTLLNENHVVNLELVAAQMAARKLAIRSLNADDVILSVEGGILIVNPYKIVSANTIETARDISASALHNFALEQGVGISQDYRRTYLASDKSAKTASKNLAKLLRVRKNIVDLPEGGEGSLVNAYDLMDQAGNTEMHRRFVTNDNLVTSSANIEEAAAMEVLEGLTGKPISQLTDDALRKTFEDVAENLNAASRRLAGLRATPIMNGGPEMRAAQKTLVEAQQQWELLNQSYKTWRDYLKGNAFDVANGVATEREVLRRRLQDGKSANIVIKVGRDQRGNLVITDGRDRLTAAILEGIENVVIRDDGVTAHLDEGALYFGAMTRQSVHWRDTLPELAANTLPGNTASADYKLFDTVGRVIQPDVTDMIPSSKELDPLDLATRITTRTFGRQANQSLLSIHARAYANGAGNTDAARVAVAQAALMSENVTQFYQFMQKLSSAADGKGLALRLDPRSVDRLGPELKKLQKASKLYLEELESIGIYTRGVDVAVKNNFVTVHFDEERQVTRFLANAEQDELTAFAQKYLNREGGAAIRVPSEKVELVNQQGASPAKVGDFVDAPRPRIIEGVPQNPRGLHLTPEKIKELEKKGIFQVEDGKELFDETGRLLVNLGEGKYNVREYDRPDMAFFLSEDGRLFVDTRPIESGNQDQLLKAIFGEASPLAGEAGVISSEGVWLNNLVGANIQRLDDVTTKAIELRLQKVAKKFQQIGVNPGLSVFVQTGMDPQIWGRHYHTPMKLDELADGKWKFDLTAAERKAGIHVAQVADAPRYVGRAIRTKGGGEAIENLIKIIRDINDTALALEVEKGLPGRAMSAYMHRRPTPRVEQAFGKLSKRAEEQATRDGPNSAKIYKDFMRARVLSELTTGEMNHLIKEIRKAGGKFDPTQVPLEEAKRLALEKDYAKLQDLAEVMDEAGIPFETNFFEEDLAVSTIRRSFEGTQSRKAMTAIEALKEEGATAFSGTSADIKALRDLQSGRNLSTIEKMQGALQRLEAQIATEAGGTATSADLVRKRAAADKLREKIGKLRAQDIDIRDRAAKAGWAKGMNANLDDGGMAYVSSDVARSGMASGLLNEGNYRGQLMGTGLVGVRTRDAIKLTTNMPGAEIHIFDAELQPALERIFGSPRQSSGAFRTMLDGFDLIQGWFKQYRLFLSPKYFTRSLVGNTWLMGVAGYGNVGDTKESLMILSTLRNVKGTGLEGIEEAVTRLKATKINSDAGGQVSAYDLLTEAVNHDLFTGSIHHNEFVYHGGASNDALKLFERDLVKMGSQRVSDMFQTDMVLDNRAIRAGRNLASQIDNVSRFSVFYQSWRRTGDFLEAANEAKRVLYDYSDLSQFERKVMRRAIPFWSWQRNNVPAMMKAAVMNPRWFHQTHKFVTQFSEAMAGGPIEEDELPEWIRKRFGMVINKRDDGVLEVLGMESVIPGYEIFGFFMGEPLKETGIRILNGFTPIIKTPIEALTNINMFTGRPVEYVPGEASKEYTLQGLGFTKRITTEGPLGLLNLVLNDQMAGFVGPLQDGSRYLGNLLKVAAGESGQGTNPTLWASLVDLAIGKASIIDPEKTQMYLQYDLKRQESLWKSAYKKAIKAGHDNAADFYQNRLNHIRLNYTGNR